MEAGNSGASDDGGRCQGWYTFSVGEFQIVGAAMLKLQSSS